MSALFAVVASAPGFPADCSAATATVTLPAVTTTLNSVVTTTVTLPAPAVTTALNSLVTTTLLSALTTTLTSSVTVSGSCPAIPPITVQQTVTATASSTCPAAAPTNPSISCSTFYQGRQYWVLYYSGTGVSPTNRNSYTIRGTFRTDLGPCSALQGCSAAIDYTSDYSFYLVFRNGLYECLSITSYQYSQGSFSVPDTAAGAIYAYYNYD